jgi:hypothetical protein
MGRKWTMEERQAMRQKAKAWWTPENRRAHSQATKRGQKAGFIRTRLCWAKAEAEQNDWPFTTIDGGW